MRKILNKYNCDLVTTIIGYIIIFLIPLQKLTVYFLKLNGVTKTVHNEHIAKLLWILIPFLIINYIINIIVKKKKIKISDVIIFVLMILTFISTKNSIFPYKSWYGEINRHEGIYTIYCYYLLFLNFKNLQNKKMIKILIIAFLVVGFFQVTYGILQVFSTFEFINHYKRHYMASALCGNPNFFGSYCVLLILYASTAYLLENKKRYLFLSIYFMIGLILANSTGPLLGFLIAIAYFLIIYRKRIDYKSFLMLVISLLTTFYISNTLNMYYHKNILKIEIEDYYFIKSDLKKMISYDPNFGSGRLIIWKNSLPALKKYWLIGSGPDTFSLTYPQEGNLVYDKAHNIYLQMAITNGIFYTLIYLLLCLITCIYSLKLKDKTAIIFSIMFIGYSVQAFANINVIEVTPYFFIIWGMLYSYFEDYKLKKIEI